MQRRAQQSTASCASASPIRSGPSSWRPRSEPEVVNEGNTGMNIGLIGLGHMGSAIATSLVRAGHDLIAFNRSPEKFRALAVLGVRRAAHIADACKADVLITSLADDAAVEQVVLAADGVVTRLRKGAIHLSMSTISVALSERLALA